MDAQDLAISVASLTLICLVFVICYLVFGYTGVMISWLLVLLVVLWPLVRSA